jgi:hypothetical protein
MEVWTEAEVHMPSARQQPDIRTNTAKRTESFIMSFVSFFVKVFASQGAQKTPAVKPPDPAAIPTGKSCPTSTRSVDSKSVLRRISLESWARLGRQSARAMAIALPCLRRDPRGTTREKQRIKLGRYPPPCRQCLRSQGHQRL